MNVFEIAAESIWWCLQVTVNSVHAFLDLNFYIVAFLLNVTNYVAETVASFSLGFLDILQCYYYDFLTFSNELALGISFIINILFNFLSRRISQIYYLSCCVIESIHQLIVKVFAVSNAGLCLLNEMLNNLIYFLTVIFNAILILLQLGPNLLIFIYESITYFCNQGWICLKLYLYSLWENLYLLPFECQNVICNVPLKAYFGLLLLLSLFHARTVIKSYMETCLELTIDQCFIIWFQILPKTIARVILFYKKCKSYFFSEESENNCHANSDSRGLFKKVSIIFEYLKNFLNFLKIPIYRVNEELSEHQLQELQKKLHAEKERHICVICHDRERTVLLYPCRHMCLCEECARTVQAAYQCCPLCRRNILDTLQVYT